MKDSGKGIFDSVIVCDASRWSRDNQKSKEGLEILRQNGIRFFVETSEHDLFSPEQTLFLGLAVEINDFYGKQQALKSIVSRIERAKKGIPTAGKLPYGRTFDKKTGQWGIDEGKKRLIERIASEYLNGAKGEVLAKKYGMNYPNLLKILKHRSGDKWEIRVRSKKLNIDETIQMKIPRLLPENVIRAIHEQATANKTYTHGETKNPYPLSSLIFCGNCGYVMFGQVNHLGKRYYRHPRGRKNSCEEFVYIPAEIVEDSVLHNLFYFFGDRKKMEKAAKDAIPNLHEIEQMKAQIVDNQKEISSIIIKKANLIKNMEAEIDPDLKVQFKKRKEQEEMLKDEIADLSSRIAEFPSEEKISWKSQLIQRQMESYYKGADHLREMTMAEKKSFFQSIFGGKDRDGNRYGVRVTQYQKKNGQKGWEFKLSGNLITPEMALQYPLVNGEKEAIDHDMPVGFFDEKLNMSGKRHAHNGFGFYK